MIADERSEDGMVDLNPPLPTPSADNPPLQRVYGEGRSGKPPYIPLSASLHFAQTIPLCPFAIAHLRVHGVIAAIGVPRKVEQTFWGMGGVIAALGPSEKLSRFFIKNAL